MPTHTLHFLPHRVFHEKPDACSQARPPRRSLPLHLGHHQEPPWPSLPINGVEDHLHILSSLHTTVSLASFVKDIKTGSALWIKENMAFKSFSHWQEGYAAFTCSRRDIGDFIEYIRTQEDHYRRTRFEEEYRKLLLEAGVELDARYLF
jgi:hypothetical protein